MPRYAYLGPEGTFTEAALVSLFAPGRPPVPTGDLLPYPSVPEALDAVRDGSADAAMVPIENSVEGAVAATLDELAGSDGLTITREVLLPVEFQLLTREPVELDRIRRVATHPHAEAQCRRWLAENLRGFAFVSAPSTAAAAAELAGDDPGFDAAIAAPIAGRRYGLHPLAEKIGDNPDAVTRFVLVSRAVPAPAPTGADKTSLVAFITDDHPGALLEVLQEFAVRGVNLTRIESRPTGGRLGRYCFSIDCEGHLADARVGEALLGLRRVCAEVRFLGSYPTADGCRPAIRRGTSDGEFAAAASWLDRVRRTGA